MAAKFLISEGDCFLVPLGMDEYALGLVARRRSRQIRSTIYACFFNKILHHEPEAYELLSLDNEVVLRCRLGDGYIRTGEWPLIGRLPGWERSNWVMPDFGRMDILNSRLCWQVSYSDEDPAKVVAENSVDCKSIKGLPSDCLMGELAVVAALRRLLSG